MAEIGTPLSSSATKVLFCGAGELGKEVIIEMMRLGVEVIAVDRYANAPGMQVAHRSHVINMLDGAELRRVIELEKPDYIVPEVEAIATDTLVELEKEGYNVIPTAKATKLTMNREGIRRLAAEELGIKTSPYRFADNFEDFKAAVKEIGIPCVIKPVMSSSGHGQSVIKTEADIQKSWDISQREGRTFRETEQRQCTRRRIEGQHQYKRRVHDNRQLNAGIPQLEHRMPRPREEQRRERREQNRKAQQKGQMLFLSLWKYRTSYPLSFLQPFSFRPAFWMSFSSRRQVFSLTVSLRLPDREQNQRVFPRSKPHLSLRQ